MSSDVCVLGCDVSKQTIDVALVNEHGTVQWTDKVLNKAGTLAAYLLTMQGVYPTARFRVVVEATGIYHYPVAEAAHAVGLECVVYNPILTKQQISGSVRAAKTDKTDAVHVARIGLRGDGRPYLPEPYMATKCYARSHQKLSGLAVVIKLHDKHMADLLGEAFSDSARNLMVGVLGAIEAAKKQLYKELAASAQGEVFTLLQTIPGIGPYVAASIIGEIQIMERFKTAKTLVAPMPDWTQGSGRAAKA